NRGTKIITYDVRSATLAACEPEMENDMKKMMNYLIRVLNYFVWLVKWYLMILGYVSLMYSALVHKIINIYTVTGTILAIILFVAYLLILLLNKIVTILVERYRNRH
ncbi:hypothetical protein FTRO_0140010, partial [Fructobacillus tropaeoli]